MTIHLDRAAVARRQANAELCDRLTERLVERFTDGNLFAGMRTKDSEPGRWPGPREVSPHDVSLVFMELLTEDIGAEQPSGETGGVECPEQMQRHAP